MVDDFVLESICIHLIFHHGLYFLLLLIVEGVYVRHCVYQVLIASPSRSFAGSSGLQQQWLACRCHSDV